MLELERYQLFLFDFDLTLADGSTCIVESYKQVLQNHGYSHTDESTIRRTIGLTVEESFNRLTGITDVAQLAELKEEYSSICRPQIVERTSFYPDGVRFILYLFHTGRKLGIISTKESRTIWKCLGYRGLESLFSLVIGRGDVVSAKPSPEGIEKAIHCMGCAKSQTLYLGDSLVDAMAAQLAFVDFVGVLKGNYTAEDFKDFPAKTFISSYDEIIPDCSALRI